MSQVTYWELVLLPAFIRRAKLVGDGVYSSTISRRRNLQTRCSMIGFIYLALILMFWFLPTFIALNKHKRNTGAIFAVNLIPVVGWVIALIWALTHDVQPQTVVVQRYPEASNVSSPSSR